MQQWEQPYFLQLTEFVRARYRQTSVFPPPARIFAAFDACPFRASQGRDSRTGPPSWSGQANGLGFSVADGVAMPPSLVNIFKEIVDDIGGTMPLPAEISNTSPARVCCCSTPHLRWTPISGIAPRHWMGAVHRCRHRGAAGPLGDCVHAVGFQCGAKSSLIDSSCNLVLKAPHPSPLSAYRGFLGCGIS